MKQVVGAVILYYPHNSVFTNLASYSSRIEKLFVVDNTPVQTKEFIEKIKTFENIVYLHDGENKGIASRLNFVCNVAKEEGFNWLLTMDQDSLFEHDQLEKYFSCVEHFANAEEVAMFGVNFTGDKIQNTDCSFKESTLIITSGSLVNLKVFEQTGGFDEELFIDEVDFEYCLKAVSKGFKTIQFTHIFLRHQLGVVSNHRSFKSNKLTPRTLHSPVRLYYLTRNFFYLKNNYGKAFNKEIDFKKKALLNRVKNNILYNKEKWKVVTYIIRGWSDYRKKRMGKIKSSY